MNEWFNHTSAPPESSHMLNTCRQAHGWLLVLNLQVDHICIFMENQGTPRVASSKADFIEDVNVKRFHISSCTNTCNSQAYYCQAFVHSAHHNHHRPFKSPWSIPKVFGSLHKIAVSILFSSQECSKLAFGVCMMLHPKVCRRWYL